MAAFQFQFHGFTPANRDLNVQLVQETTGKTIERKPFLDGSLLVRDLDAGFYQVKVSHPNVINPIDQRRIRLFPQKPPTTVRIPIPAELFRDTPIRDIPDADLAPVQQAATSARDQLRPLANKIPGEVIRSGDWNLLVDAVADLSGAVLQLTNLVSPQGHAHPEIAEKIDEVQGNILRFAEAFGRSILELQREIETANLKSNVHDVLDLGEVPDIVRGRVLNRLKDLDDLVQADTSHFTQKLAATGGLLLSEINDIAAAKGDGADQFLKDPKVQNTVKIAQQYVKTGTLNNPAQEINAYTRTTAVAGGKLSNIVRGR